MARLTSERRARGRPRGSGAQGAESATTVQALDRAIALLQALARDGRATLSALALRANVPASSAHRLLVTLQAHRLVDFNEASQDWMVGVEAFRIGSAFTQRDTLVEAAREALRQLVDDTGETANLGIEDDGEVVFLAQVDTQNPVRAFFRAGSRAPMHASGIGKALLAEFEVARLEKVLRQHGLPSFTERTLTTAEALHADLALTRGRGWSLDDEERYFGMRCIAAPVFNAFGEVVAGLSISGPAVRFADHSLADLGAKVRLAASDVTEQTGGKPPRKG